MERRSNTGNIRRTTRNAGASQSRRPPTPPQQAAPRRRRRRPISPEVQTAQLMRKRRRGITYSVSVVSALFFSFIIVYLAWSGVQFFRPNVATEVVRMDTLEVQLYTTGIIVRNERVYRAPQSGTVVSRVHDFDRVRDGDVVVSIADIDAVEVNRRALRDIEDQALSLHDRRFHTGIDEDVARINEGLRNMMDRGMPNFSTMNISEIYQLNERLHQQTEMRNQTIINNIRHVRQDIRREHDLLQSVQDLHMQDMTATSSGIVSPLIDGLEEVFNHFDVMYLSRAETLMDVDHRLITPATHVEEGDPVFKVIGNTWYVAAFMPADEVAGFAIGQQRTIFLESLYTGRFEPVQMRVIHVYPSGREVFIVFRSSRNILLFLNQRSVNIRTSDNVVNGLRIPVTAIATRVFVRVPVTHLHGYDRNRFVMRFIGEGLGHERVGVTVHNIVDGYANVLQETSGLGIGDTLAPFDLEHASYLIHSEHITLVHGVYRANQGVAEFRQIVLEQELPEIGHVILNPQRNRGLMQFDTIVTDATTVRDGDIVS